MSLPPSFECCFECAGVAEFDHHVVPRSRGGTRTVSLCASCHGKAHDRTMTSSSLIQDAMDRLRARGELAGQVPYGSKLADDGRTLLPDTIELQALGHARRWRDEGRSLRQIATSLTLLGIPTKYGGAWRHSTVGEILRRSSVDDGRGVIDEPEPMVTPEPTPEPEPRQPETPVEDDGPSMEVEEDDTIPTVGEWPAGPPFSARDSLTHQLREHIHGRFATSYSLSKVSGVSARVIARFLSGERDIRLETADRLARVLDLKLVDVGSPAPTPEVSSA